MTNTYSRTAESSTKPIVRHSTTWGQDAETTPVYAVTAAVADATDVDQLELPPLYEAINPDALNALFTSGAGTSASRVSFQYAGYTVIVLGSGEVHVHSAQ